MPMWIHLPRAPIAILPRVRGVAAHGAMLSMRRYGGTAQAMRLTPRCIDLLRLLAAARWLTTRQIHYRFFRDATIDTARKRLRKLTSGKYLGTVREGRMNEALFTLGCAGKRVLETARV